MAGRASAAPTGRAREPSVGDDGVRHPDGEPDGRQLRDRRPRSPPGSRGPARLRDSGREQRLDPPAVSSARSRSEEVTPNPVATVAEIASVVARRSDSMSVAGHRWSAISGIDSTMSSTSTPPSRTARHRSSVRPPSPGPARAAAGGRARSTSRARAGRAVGRSGVEQAGARVTVGGEVGGGGEERAGDQHDAERPPLGLAERLDRLSPPEGREVQGVVTHVADAADHEGGADDPPAIPSAPARRP